MDALKKIELEEFLKKLNQDPPNEHIFKTPDKKADDLPISYVENKLDELYFGLWGARNFKTERIEKTGKKLFGFIPSVALPWTVAGLSFGAMMGSSLLQKLIEKLVS